MTSNIQALEGCLHCGGLFGFLVSEYGTRGRYCCGSRLI